MRWGGRGGVTLGGARQPLRAPKAEAEVSPPPALPSRLTPLPAPDGGDTGCPFEMSRQYGRLKKKKEEEKKKKIARMILV